MTPQTIRALERFDVEVIKEIHEKFYKTEFDFPEFFKNFLCAFVVEENGKIVTAGGIRTIAELVLITNKDLSVRARRQSLFKALDTSLYISGKFGYDHLHAFVQDEPWEKHLKSVGFTDCIGKSICLGV